MTVDELMKVLEDMTKAGHGNTEIYVKTSRCAAQWLDIRELATYTSLDGFTVFK